MHVSKNGNRIAIKVMSVFALMLFAGTMWAQNIKVTGKVTDSKGEPLVGVVSRPKKCLHNFSRYV